MPDSSATVRLDAHSAEDLPHRFRPRVLEHEDEAWTVVDGLCPGPVAALFTARHQPLLGWVDAGEVGWAPIVER